MTDGKKIFLVPEETFRKKYRDEEGTFTIADEIIDRLIRNSVELTSEELEDLKFGIDISIRIDDIYNKNYNEERFKNLLKKLEEIL